MAEKLFPTTVVGSYPQPDWLVDREMLSKVVPRVRMKEMWRVPEAYLEQAQDDATIIAIRDMERAGIDVITDGEMRRESYSNRFATALEGIDTSKPGFVKARSGQMTPVPRVVGKIRRPGPVEVRDMQFLRRNTDRTAKITLPGPFTMSQQAHDEYYKDTEALAMDMAAAVNEEVLDLVRAGAESRAGAPLRCQGDQPRATGRHGADGGAPVFRLRRGRARRQQAAAICLPRRIGRHGRRHDLDRGGAAEY
jgi:5-methyltetrahydropteroyltriglutamate--homocysteine methyltransferase